MYINMNIHAWAYDCMVAHVNGVGLIWDIYSYTWVQRAGMGSVQTSLV